MADNVLVFDLYQRTDTAEVPPQQTEEQGYLKKVKHHFFQENDVYFSSFGFLFGLMVVSLFALILIYYMLQTSDMIMESNNIKDTVSMHLSLKNLKNHTLVYKDQDLFSNGFFTTPISKFNV